MPIYDYRCKACGHVDEVVVGSSMYKHKCTFCGSADCNRDYANQTIAVVPDIEPAFNDSLGVRVSSRKELREELAKHNAWSPDIPHGNPSDGVLTQEERNNNELSKGTVFDKRKKSNWAESPSGMSERSVDRTDMYEPIIDGIVTEGKADYRASIDDIKASHVKRLGDERRRTKYGTDS